MDGNLKFPDGFLWGSSISSHQTEGNLTNDWTEWEQSEKRVKDLVKEGALNNNSLNNFISGDAAKHFHLYKEDFNLAKELGHNALRISLEWSRIEPEKGKYSEAGLEHYLDVISHLKEIGIEPMVTVWHWTLPVWLRDEGGWLNKKTPEYFENYSRKVVQFFKGKVKFWITLNEPELYANQSYLQGLWPPQRKNPYHFLVVINNLIHGHRLAYDAIKKISPEAQIGIAKNNIHFEPHKKIWFNRIHAALAHYLWNDYFLMRIKDKQDYIGLNYYFRNTLHLGKVKNENKIVSDLGWELFPEGIFHLLRDLKKYNKPVYITENGLADATDKQRSWFISQILQYVHKAINEGVDVKGYLHWSLIDNFEWDKGFFPRFGLVEVDYKTQIRKPRKSAEFYAEIMKNNGLGQSHIK